MAFNEMADELITMSGQHGNAVEWLAAADELIQSTHDTWTADIPEYEDEDVYEVFATRVAENVPAHFHQELVNGLKSIDIRDFLMHDYERDPYFYDYSIERFENAPQDLTRELVYELLDYQDQGSDSDFYIILHLFLEKFLGKVYKW